MASRTAALKERYLDGDHVFVAGGPLYPNRADGRWPVMYVPRFTTDPQPWASVGTEFRYSAGELFVVTKDGTAIHGAIPRTAVTS